jgi:hypothetical protein
MLATLAGWPLLLFVVLGAVLAKQLTRLYPTLIGQIAADS